MSLQVQNNTTLPSKEQSLFKRVVKCYEQKQYKNGLKFARSILSNPKYTEHGETLAMKGLLLNCLGKKEEALQNVHRGLKNDLKSYVCWHVYGMLQLFDKKYEEAIKCYRNALRIDQEQVQILKDLSKIQIHIRDIEGFRETRYKLLKLRPTQQTSWIHLALAENFSSNYEMCLKILSEFVNTQNITSVQYENSELLKYQNFVMVQAGKYQDALQHLTLKENLICDKFYILETKADLLCKLNKPEEGILVYWNLVTRNQENLSYYQGIENGLRIKLGQSELSTQDKMHIYEKALQINPSALLPQTIPLQFTSHQQFKELVDKFLQKNLRKGIPSLFKLIKTLYTDQNKVDIMDELINGYVRNLEAHNKLDLSQTNVESPTTLLWALVLKSRHCSKLGHFTEALDCLNRTINHTPTFVDAYTTKAKIYKNNGNIIEGLRVMRECQSFDTADRYLNCLYAKYSLQANLVNQANEILSKFTKENTIPSEDLNEMQCMWYLLACASSYKIMSDYGQALKKCHQIYKHFQDMLEDQYDFHTYCPRKMTLVSYVQTLISSFNLKKPQEELPSYGGQDKRVGGNHYFMETAQCAIEIYIKLYDDPGLVKKLDSLVLDRVAKEKEMEYLAQNIVTNTDQDNDKISNTQSNVDESNNSKLMNGHLEPNDAQMVGSDKLSSADIKKLRNKERKAQLKQKSNSDQRSGNNDDGDSNSLEPKDFIGTSNPLEQAIKFLTPLSLNFFDNFKTHCLSFNIYIRKKKLFLVLRALINMRRILDIESTNSFSPSKNLCNADSLQNNLLFYECWVKFMHFMWCSERDGSSFIPNIPSDIKEILLEKQIDLLTKYALSIAAEDLNEISWNELFSNPEALANSVNKFVRMHSEMISDMSRDNQFYCGEFSYLLTGVRMMVYLNEKNGSPIQDTKLVYKRSINILMLCLSRFKSHQLTSTFDYKSFLRKCFSALYFMMDINTKSGNTDNSSTEGLVQEFISHLRCSMYPLIDIDLILPYVPFRHIHHDI
ncbi:N-alpha-acetyltransferase 16, NatA auxiliary subunit-like [Gordionus sp. m RMFG-2023]|uniref:N-alpha-acetyltransferase 16, NatA auxiliary subunit-like n=1 Tax=Gordionus sp. m RMFG-2023 TaxID=3053472 RepID=UPI0031FDE0F0